MKKKRIFDLHISATVRVEARDPRSAEGVFKTTLEKAIAEYRGDKDSIIGLHEKLEVMGYDEETPVEDEDFTGATWGDR